MVSDNATGGRTVTVNASEARWRWGECNDSSPYVSLCHLERTWKFWRAPLSWKLIFLHRLTGIGGWAGVSLCVIFFFSEDDNARADKDVILLKNRCWPSMGLCRDVRRGLDGLVRLLFEFEEGFPAGLLKITYCRTGDVTCCEQQREDTLLFFYIWWWVGIEAQHTIVLLSLTHSPGYDTANIYPSRG